MCIMFDEMIETSNHITDDMRESDSGMPFSVEELKGMGIPDREIQAFVTEYNDAKDWKRLQIQAHQNEFAMESNGIEIIS